jgi:hypothetical protein
MILVHNNADRNKRDMAAALVATAVMLIFQPAIG